MKLNLHYDGATRAMTLVHAETGEAVEGVQGISFYINSTLPGTLVVEMAPGAVFLDNVDQVEVEERDVQTERRRIFRR